MAKKVRSKRSRTGSSEGAQVNQCAKRLGKRGGEKGGPARDEAISSGRKKEIARMGGKARSKQKRQTKRKSR